GQRRISDQALVEAETRDVIEEIERGRNAPRREVGARVGESGEEDRGHRRQQQRLNGETLQNSSTHARPHRTGGAYCSPPCRHCALKLRGIFSGESWPRLRSKISP